MLIGKYNLSKPFSGQYFKCPTCGHTLQWEDIKLNHNKNKVNGSVIFSCHTCSQTQTSRVFISCKIIDSEVHFNEET